jgi:hypothetical protein
LGAGPTEAPNPAGLGDRTSWPSTAGSGLGALFTPSPPYSGCIAFLCVESWIIPAPKIIAEESKAHVHLGFVVLSLQVELSVLKLQVG